MRKYGLSQSYELRSVWLIAFLALYVVIFASCRPHKEMQQQSSLAVDSMARMEQHRAILTLDSLIRHIEFSFDTLRISIEPDSPKVIRLTATHGRITDSRRTIRRQADLTHRLDTAGRRLASASTTTGRTTPVRHLNLPFLALLALLLLAAYFAASGFARNKP